MQTCFVQASTSTDHGRQIGRWEKQQHMQTEVSMHSDLDGP